MRPTTTSGGPGHPYYNLIQLTKLMNVFLSAICEKVLAITIKLFLYLWCCVELGTRYFMFNYFQICKVNQVARWSIPQSSSGEHDAVNV